MSGSERMVESVFDSFSHFLAYGSTDQETLRELTDDYGGLIVPGTIAAYQSEGTRGFVLTLSAAIKKPYAIDPRTPLFQYLNVTPKQSHLALARVLGIDEVVAKHGWVPFEKWTPLLQHDVAKAWLDFNTAYVNIAPKQFDKYARRLGRKPKVIDASAPSIVFAPYLMDNGSDEISAVNDGLWSAAQQASSDAPDRLRRVIAASSPAVLLERARHAGQQQIATWVDNLDEVDIGNGTRLAEYARVVSQLDVEGFELFAMYGGFFAAALRTVGLRGASHGVGFSEHRDHVELKSSGGAPARFYVQRIHRYLPVEVASELWRQRPSLVESYYPGYASVEPGAYSYHDLMKHSVRARADEILKLTDVSAAEVANALDADYSRFRSELELTVLSTAIERRVLQSLAPLPVWANALRSVARV